MGTKQRSIFILIAVFLLGGLSGYFGHGLYDQYRRDDHRERKNPYGDRSRFVGYFLSVIEPERSQTPEIEAILAKWDGIMDALQTRFKSESATGFQGMFDEMRPHLHAEQSLRLQQALERFASHRKRTHKGKSD